MQSLNKSALPTNRRLGALIAAYRERRLWCQEELAFAAGTDQAHISRIESNQTHPQFQTLTLICEALNLSIIEQEEIFHLGGFLISPPLPDDNDTTRVLHALQPVLDSYPYPAMVLDEGERIWFWNSFCFYPWGQFYEAFDQNEFALRVRGKCHLEFIFDPQHYPDSYSVWASRWENFDRITRRNVELLWRAFRIRQRDPQMNRCLNRLKTNPAFFKIWQECIFGPEETIMLEHDTQAVRTDLGRLEFRVWRTHVTTDTRFVVVHFTPSNVGTIDALARVAKNTKAIRME